MYLAIFANLNLIQYHKKNINIICSQTLSISIKRIKF